MNMSIRINENKCIGCGKCSKICPGNLIELREAVAIIKNPLDCWGCTACLKECNHGAIEFFLNDDMGGKGGYMITKIEDNRVTWCIRTKENKEIELKTNRLESNKL